MRVFFIGVCGTAMGNAAILLKKMGHRSGRLRCRSLSTMSDVLFQSGIDLFEGFSEDEMIDWRPEQVVVGNAVSREMHR